MDAKILEASNRHLKPADRVFQYGTAGFRMKANLLDSVVFRVGLVAALRSRKLGGQTIGVMITASHNPPEDNGVKLVDPMGEMLENSWEAYSTQLANAKNEDVVDVYRKLEKDLKINPEAPASEVGYYEKLAKAFERAMKGKKAVDQFTVDCANGVGGPKLDELIKYLPKGILDIKVINDDVLKAENLNHECGADFVKTKQRAPPSSRAGNNDRCCSLDGDADRIIYYFNDPDHGFRLLDGDRIATLAASFIGDLAREAGLADELRIGVVQTAYANGASTKYVEKTLKLPVVCTPTGVKWLHHAATKFDVGVYFEANGHGTVVFSQQALKAFSSTEPESPAQASALETLRALTDLINQTVGDALSDMLLVETILAHKSWTPKRMGSYLHRFAQSPCPSRSSDRNVFKTTDAERKLVEPQEVLHEQVVPKMPLRVYAEAATRSEADDLASKVASLCKIEGSIKG
ncbi:hypothetical protein DID88_001239 [Monilinia fructigena]|uniref:phosphoacetylglucosamine mutase n=1 Tax=Monilinia fructigena TaxID=38457 RepID=A0A395J0D0_9HELO|nr:hypothetical protein DID88_001239 [Monilinia fructigena]